MVAKDRQNGSGPPKSGVGEIDTSAPFQSVKDAVNLFGEGAFSGEKPVIKKSRPHSAERVLAKETQLHISQKELSKFEEQLKNAESTKAQAQLELEIAKRTLDELTYKLKTVCESKESAIKATESAKNQAKQLEETLIGGGPTTTNDSWKHESDISREQYIAAIRELDAAKKERTKIRHDSEAAVEEKAFAFKQALEAELAAKSNMERAGDLSKEITAIQDSIGLVKFATLEAQQEVSKVFAEKDVQKQLHKAKLEESAKKLNSLKNENDPKLSENLETRLAETESEIGILKKEMASKRGSDNDSVRIVTTELDDAKESLHNVVEEENSLRNLVASLKLELESVKKEHMELKEKEAETESVAGNLHVKLRDVKLEVETAASEESKVRGASEEMISTLHLLSSESENSRREAEEMKERTQELKNEYLNIKTKLEEAEKNLSVALEEADAAKVDEAKALDQIKSISERTSAARTSTSESGDQITISREEFESLNRKVDESGKLAAMKIDAAMAQVEAVRASENEAVNKLEKVEKEMEDMRAGIDEALRKAKMAESARKAVEGELKRWREREQRKAAETASRILAESEVLSSPANYRPAVAVVETRRLEKAKTSVTKKVLLPTLSGIFHKKRNQVEGGGSSPGQNPSYY
jgi:chromosome segregation ATPase